MESGSAAVAVVQAADHRFGDDLSLVGRFDFARHWSISIQWPMRPRFVIVTREFRDDAAQVPLAQDDDVVRH